MDSLRLTLLIAGIVFVVAIYFYEKIRRRDSDQRYSRFGGSGENDFVPRTPTKSAMPANTADYGDIPDDLEEDYDDYDKPSHDEALRDITDELQQLEGIIANRDEDIEQLEIGGLAGTTDNVEQDEQPDEVIMVNMLARDDRIMAGPDILDAAIQQDLRFGDMGFFHRLDDEDRVIFSMANALQPGSFEISEMETVATRGLVFFMSLPGYGDPLANFDAMLTTIRDMASRLHGQLYDETRSVLTRQGIDTIRTRISEYKIKSMNKEESA